MNKFCQSFTNTQCGLFPCREHVSPENFSCQFCFCPMYFLERCLGNPYYLEDGTKSCERCTFPYDSRNRDKIIRYLAEEFEVYAKKRIAEKEENS